MKITILILAANPKNTSRLRLDEEIREIDIGLQMSRKRDDFILHKKMAVRPVDFRRAVLDIKPNILHFCGHGEGAGGLAFEDDMGHVKLVSAEALAGFFELFAETVQCVVLNACYSDIQAKAIANHIDYVVGMKAGISDIAAIEFAVAFYDALGAGENIEFAYRLACNAILWTGVPESLTPIINSKKLVGNELLLDIEKVWAGQWSGTWRNPQGHRFDFALNLLGSGNGRFEGHIIWTMVTSPLQGDKNKLGLPAKEFVIGTWHSETQEMILVGQRVDDPHQIIATDTYKLVVSSNGDAITGISEYVGTWAGKMVALKTK